MSDLLDMDALKEMSHANKDFPDGHPHRLDPNALHTALKEPGLTPADNFAILVKHEQRLNRLDALDENNLGKSSRDKMAQFLRLWETKYWRQDLGEDGSLGLLHVLHEHHKEDIVSGRVNGYVPMSQVSPEHALSISSSMSGGFQCQ
eukprot:gnl/TRDRNA2_/TRDRNA2_176649_c3_seq2.p1 gnl/TRDRNA2_/TRDRNA2_176649_c3~~gnl/TRDRNA2_/TRDRNA2_176649_c3_seq2.p1  ORF type:complete len:170 (+),score=19.10 gnl/TRDRNA2_/TRDRNA2_176649_c3_seq2:71-511(+)